MTTRALRSADAIKRHLLETLNTCPADQCNPVDCPLHDLRQLDFRKRVRWLNSLALEDLNYLAAYHTVCMQIKLAAEHLPPPS